MADALHCYTGSGTKQYSLYMPSSIITLQLLATATSRNTKCVVVALANGEVRVYNDKALASIHTSPSPVTGLCAGKYAREDNSLITVTAAGGLDIKVGIVCAVWSPVWTTVYCLSTNDVRLSSYSATHLCLLLLIICLCVQQHMQIDTAHRTKVKGSLSTFLTSSCGSAGTCCAHRLSRHSKSHNTLTCSNSLPMVIWASSHMNG